MLELIKLWLYEKKMKLHFQENLAEKNGETDHEKWYRNGQINLLGKILEDIEGIKE